ncbi:MAG: hypothetical protein AAGJ35_05030 [Myxococcota bacterium]
MLRALRVTTQTVALSDESPDLDNDNKELLQLHYKDLFTCIKTLKDHLGTKVKLFGHGYVMDTELLHMEKTSPDKQDLDFHFHNATYLTKSNETLMHNLASQIHLRIEVPQMARLKTNFNSADNTTNLNTLLKNKVQTTVLLAFPLEI